MPPEIAPAPSEVRCRKCGRKWPEGTDPCPKCGHRLRWSCARCGNENSKSTRYCTCGARRPPRPRRILTKMRVRIAAIIAVALALALGYLYFLVNSNPE
jgi:predicted amidophosphoribosyltransferase